MRSDEELMAAYVAGEAAAFDEIFRRYSPVLLRTMRRQLSRPEDATDLVQQAFLHLHRSRKDFQPGRRLKPWLFTIAINLKREYFRRWKRRPESTLEGLPEGSWKEGPKGQERADAQQTLAHAFAKISEDQREVIAMHWFDGLSFPEVAEIIGSSVSAVKVRAHRGYVALRQALDDSGNREPELPYPSRENADG